MIEFLIFLVVLSLVSVWAVDRIRLPEPAKGEKIRRDKILDFLTGILVLICSGVWLGGALSLFDANSFLTAGGLGYMIWVLCFSVWLITVGVYLKRFKKSYILAGMITAIVTPFVLFGFCFLLFSHL